jgi:hypothetical protein
VVGLEAHEQREGFGVVLLLGVEGGLQRRAIVELGLEPFFQECRIGDPAAAKLDLPVVGEELLVFPADSAAEGFLGREVDASRPKSSMPWSSKTK